LSRAEVIFSFLRYEIKRAIARRKVLALVAFTVLIDTLPYYALSTSGTTIIPLPDYPYLWAGGLLEPFSALFLNFITILIAAGAMSEEYEQGTAELLLSKPIRRTDYFTGKYLGGYVLFLLILALNMILNVASASLGFGPQDGLGVLPGLFLVQAFSGLVFYSISFMMGELVRRSSLSYIFASATFFASTIIAVYMDLIYSITGKAFYETVHTYLPTTPVGSLPTQYILPQLPQISNILQLLGNGGTSGASIGFDVLLILAYAVVGTIISIVFFTYSDISRKIS
jgi:ABC-2 type transport system permease protein